MFATTPEKIEEVLKTFTKTQRIGLRQEYGSRKIFGISHDKSDGYVVVHFGVDFPVVRHSFFLRKTGKLAHRTVLPVLRFEEEMQDEI